MLKEVPHDAYQLRVLNKKKNVHFRELSEGFQDNFTTPLRMKTPPQDLTPQPKCNIPPSNLERWGGHPSRAGRKLCPHYLSVDHNYAVTVLTRGQQPLQSIRGVGRCTVTHGTGGPPPLGRQISFRNSITGRPPDNGDPDARKYVMSCYIIFLLAENHHRRQHGHRVPCPAQHIISCSLFNQISCFLHVLPGRLKRSMCAHHLSTHNHHKNPAEAVNQIARHTHNTDHRFDRYHTPNPKYDPCSCNLVSCARTLYLCCLEQPRGSTRLDTNKADNRSSTTAKVDSQQRACASYHTWQAKCKGVFPFSSGVVVVAPSCKSTDTHALCPPLAAHIRGVFPS